MGESLPLPVVRRLTKARTDAGPAGIAAAIVDAESDAVVDAFSGAGVVRVSDAVPNAVERALSGAVADAVAVRVSVRVSARVSVADSAQKDEARKDEGSGMKAEGGRPADQDDKHWRERGWPRATRAGLGRDSDARLLSLPPLDCLIAGSMMARMCVRARLTARADTAWALEEP
jgi:hypothetical protein